MSLINTFSGSSGGTSNDRLPSYINNKITDITVDMFDTGQTTVPDYCFAYKSIKSVTLPATIKTLGVNVFSNCTSLTDINFSSNNNTIDFGSSIFEYCSSLKNIDLSNLNVTCRYANPSWFNSCSNLISVKLPSTLSNVGSMFFYCSSLTSIDLSNLTLATSTNGYIFYFCRALTSCILPPKLKSIESYSFNYCSSLPSIDIPNTIISIDSSSFVNCSALKTINVHYKTGSTPYKSNSPWGATNATVNYIEDV